VTLNLGETTRPCRDVPDLFTAPDGERGNTAEYFSRVNAAKAVCYGCPIIWACRDEGRRLAADGVWGGEDERERKAVGGPGRQPATRPRQVARCGTESGARRHRRREEPVCAPCLQAESLANQLRKAGRRRPAECGTRAGYLQHRRRRERACDQCRYANAAADRRLHTTGSTVAA
jgi:hypothetical protein